MRFSILIFIIALFIGCNKSEKNEQFIMKPKKMIDVLYDVHLAEGIATHRDFRGAADMKKYTTDEMFKSVLKKHDITIEMFQKSLYHYGRKTKEFDKMYQQVLDRFNKEREKLSKKDNLPELKEEKLQEAAPR
ncbi:DUF4296 domain-containing protein [Prolixibacteraceae bacterium JC049]|nr:DUF4296 domain-containing protein [Prolixibacteraceae bacterium JC049]